MPTSRFSAHVPFQDVIHNKYYFLHFSGMMVFLAKRDQHLIRNETWCRVVFLTVATLQSIDLVFGGCT